jgi:hypothetical protein
MPMPKTSLRAVKCATCKKEVLRTVQSISRSGSGLFFCDRACKNRGQTKEAALIGHAKKQKSLDKKKKLRKCLGWCGNSFKTTASRRFCESCTTRKEFAATGIDEFDQMSPFSEVASTTPEHATPFDAQSL